MTPADLQRLIVAMTDLPWHAPREGWLSDSIIAGGEDVTMDNGAFVVVQANTNRPYRANLDGISALANHATALAALYEAARAVVTAKNPEQDLVARRALIAAYERLEAVLP